MATIPNIPVEAAGAIATSSDQNAWANACKFYLGSAATTKPVFFLMASTAQAWSATQAAVNFSNTATVFKDNDSGFNNGTPSFYTVKTSGYWSVDWTVNGGTTASNLNVWCQVVTTASNSFNPSVTVQFQNTNTAQTTGAAFASSGGLIPIYLFVGDQISLQVMTGAASTAGTSPFSHISGELVSS